MNNNRDNSPQYKAWRLSVLKRDRFKCRKCGNKKVKLYCHHIRNYASFPQLRYETSNGICLCASCHQLMWGQEENWVSLCYTLLAGPKIKLEYGRILRGETEKEI